jgi:hypothetical protein
MEGLEILLERPDWRPEWFPDCGHGNCQCLLGEAVSVNTAESDKHTFIPGSKMMKRIVSGALIAAAAGLAGCEQGPKSGKGFTLPDGDAARGQETFVALQCHACHSVSGVELPAIEPELDPHVKLGGEVPRVSTYGELVTSIINPSHRLAKGYKPEVVATDGESKMANYNEVMTVQQLIDLVAFLQSHYKLQPYEPTNYPLYH